MPSYLPPKKRICLDLNHYSIPCATEDKIDQSTLSLTTIRESLPNLTVQQNPKRSIAVEKIQGPLNYFYLFRWLPQELQLLIWETATAEIEAQIITISSETKRPQPSQHVTQHRPSRAYVHSETIFLTAQYTIPNILHACGNARDMALKYYRPVFARELGGAPIYMAIDAALAHPELPHCAKRHGSHHVRHRVHGYRPAAVPEPAEPPLGDILAARARRALDRGAGTVDVPATCPRATQRVEVSPLYPGRHHDLATRDAEADAGSGGLWDAGGSAQVRARSEVLLEEVGLQGSRDETDVGASAEGHCGSGRGKKGTISCDSGVSSEDSQGSFGGLEMGMRGMFKARKDVGERQVM
ncbi:hypothetical protein DSL72_003545 [Monilinia vaccinii-corymbosi]|uniref:2EXR domain-containing protein n=1 Tax=Monilinia vaccinii-corymbosi TaxID=61207 RepID=A0A8A3NTL3_9HELO|nr:hypothetical protein DSL72_003545 [Monilinia vaccinii-corymbosi]